MKIRTKLLAYFLFIAIIPMVLTGVFLLEKATEDITANSINQFQILNQQKINLIEQLLKQYKGDLLILKDSPALLNFIQKNEDDKQWRDYLGNLFESVMKAHVDIDQLRYIDKTGLEKIKVVYDGDKIISLKKDELQNKSQRYYFTEIMKMQKDELFVSQLDLNEEFNKVELPYKPVIRMGMQVYSKGVLTGMLVINIRMKNFLEVLGQNKLGDTILIDQDGQYLLHPDKNKEFAVQLNKNDNYFIDRPELQENLKKYDRKNHYDKKENEFRVWQKFFLNENDKNRYWVLVLRIKASHLFSNIQNLRNYSFLIIALSFVISVFLAFLVSRSFSRPIQKVTEIAKKISQGDFDAKIELNKQSQKTEMGILTQAINQMSHDLKQMVTSLELSRKNENELRKLSDVVIDKNFYGIFLLNREGEILRVNRAIESIFGYLAKELVGQNIQILLPDLFFKNETDLAQNFYGNLKQTSVASGSDLSGKRKDGSSVSVQIGFVPLYIEGEMMVIATVVDISELKKIDRMKTEFVSTVSHELRTPLTSIKGSLGLILGGASGAITEKTRQLIEIAFSNCDRLVRLIGDILDIEKIESGKLDLQMKRNNLFSIIENVVEANKAYASQFSVHLVVEKPDFEPFVFCDEDKIVQVLTNLVSNAVKFSPKGGNIYLSVSKNDKKIRFEIRDQGPGIPVKFDTHIFQKFSQADSSNTRQKGGTGLGLYICKTIIEKHGGMIGYKPGPESGSIFFFELDCMV